MQCVRVHIGTFAALAPSHLAVPSVGSYIGTFSLNAHWLPSVGVSIGTFAVNAQQLHRILLCLVLDFIFARLP